MLVVDGALQVTVDNEPIEINARGAALTAEVGSSTNVLKLVRSWRSARNLARLLSQALYEQGLTLTVTRAGRPLVRLGREASQRSASRILRIPHFELLPRDRT